MAWFYNFNFDENKMYCMPIAKMYEASSNHKRWIRITKEHDTIPRTTDPYVEGFVTYKVHEFPETVYKRCFWMEERDDKKAEEIRRRYLEARAKKEAEKCTYCDAEENKDIFFNFLPAMFGIEKENHDYNQDVTVFITDKAELELCVMMGDDYLLKEKKKIKYCPFCGRKLREDSKKYKLIRYIHEWDDPVELGEFDSIDEAKKAGRADMEKVFSGRWFTTMEDWKYCTYGLKNEALHGDDDYIYVITEKEVTQ